MTSSRRSAMTIDQILDAAEDVLLAHGIVGLTLSTVAERAGITKGGLLYHFRTKNDLERSIERRFIARIEHRLSKLQPGTSDFLPPCSRRSGTTGKREKIVLHP